MAAPKYRTDAQAYSCPGFWYRKTCRHYRAYRDAVSLVEAQDAVNTAWPPVVGLSQVQVSRIRSVNGAGYDGSTARGEGRDK